jgi:hypothetical protein
MLILFLRLVPVLSPEEYSVRSLGKILQSLSGAIYSVPSPAWFPFCEEHYARSLGKVLVLVLAVMLILFLCLASSLLFPLLS